MQEALFRLGVLPPRTAANLEEFRDAVAGVSEMVIEVTQRHQVRQSRPRATEGPLPWQEQNAHREKYGHCYFDHRHFIY